jgi:hypothetical protein
MTVIKSDGNDDLWRRLPQCVQHRRFKSMVGDPLIHLSFLIAAYSWINRGVLYGCIAMGFCLLGLPSRFNRYELPYLWRTWALGLTTVLGLELIHDSFRSFSSFLVLWSLLLVLREVCKDARKNAERQFLRHFYRGNDEQ